MNRFLLALFVVGTVLTAMPANAQLGRLRDRARRAVERAADQAGTRAEIESRQRADEAAAEAAADAQHPHRAEIEAAADALAALWAEHYDDFKLPGQSGFDYSYISTTWQGDDERARISGWLSALEEAEGLLAQAQPHMQLLHEHLPNSDDPWAVSNDLHALGLEMDGGMAYRKFHDAAEEMAQFRQLAAESAAGTLGRSMQTIRDFGDISDTQIALAADMQQSAALAQQFDPTNEALSSVQAELADFEGELRDQMLAQIEAGRWPGHAGGAPSGLAPGILAYFRSLDQWTDNGERVLAVAVRGGWRPAKHNLLGQVIQWQLPIVVVSTKPKWEAYNAARMYEVSVLSQEGLPSRQGPPYDGFWVGLGGGYIALDRVPGQ